MTRADTDDMGVLSRLVIIDPAWLGARNPRSVYTDTSRLGPIVINVIREERRDLLHDLAAYTGGGVNALAETLDTSPIRIRNALRMTDPEPRFDPTGLSGALIMDWRALRESEIGRRYLVLTRLQESVLAWAGAYRNALRLQGERDPLGVLHPHPWPSVPGGAPPPKRVDTFSDLLPGRAPRPPRRRAATAAGPRKAPPGTAVMRRISDAVTIDPVWLSERTTAQAHVHSGALGSVMTRMIGEERTRIAHRYIHRQGGSVARAADELGIGYAALSTTAHQRWAEPQFDPYGLAQAVHIEFFRLVSDPDDTGVQLAELSAMVAAVRVWAAWYRHGLLLRHEREASVPPWPPVSPTARR